MLLSMPKEMSNHYFSLYPSETPQYVLHQVREQLQANKDVYIAGEIEQGRGGKVIGTDDAYISSSNLIISPSRPTSMLDVKILNEFMNGLIRNLSPKEKKEFKPYLGGHTDYDYTGVEIGALQFEEIVGVIFRDFTRRVILYQPNLRDKINKSGIETEDTTKTQMTKIKRTTIISVYPESGIADIVYRYKLGLESGEIREFYDGSDSLRRLDRLVMLRNVDDLHAGRLERCLAQLKERSRKTEN